MERLLVIAIGYVFGLFQSGFLLGKIFGVDIRTKGSGNSGTTNTLRVLGWKAGFITFLFDAMKCIAAVLLVRYLFANSDHLFLLAMYAGLGATLGHNFPFYMQFKGGKGIAVMSGLVIITAVYTSLWLIWIPLFIFASAVVLSRYVSLGSLQVSVMFFTMMLFLGQFMDFGLRLGARIEFYAVIFVLMVLAWYMHRENIKRLFDGSENQLRAHGKHAKQLEEKKENDVNNYEIKRKSEDSSSLETTTKEEKSNHRFQMEG